MNNMQLKPYQEYRDSGIQWIGEIPEAWEILRIRGVCELTRGRVISIEEISENEGKYPVYSSQTSNNGEMGRINTYAFNGEYVTWTTDGANAGTAFYRNGKFNCTNVCGIMKRKNDKIYMKILPYILNYMTKFYVRYDINPKLMNNMMARIEIPLPPFPDQTAIANFLDKKTTEIDTLIEKDKKLIKLLKEKRTALINHAVTKGLDSNVKLKDSGIEWIGKIPEGWKLKKFKHIFLPGGLIRGPFGSSIKIEFFIDKGYKVYEQKNAIKHDANIGASYIDKNKYNELIRFSVKENDIIMSCSGTIGKILIIPKNYEKGIINQALLIMRLTNEVNIKYFEYIFNSNFIQKQIIDNSMGGAMKNLVAMDIFKSTKILLPSLPEQTAIVNFLDKATAKIDKTIQKIEKKIALLEEYKKSLIHHVVTGKVDVRGLPVRASRTQTGVKV